MEESTGATAEESSAHPHDPRVAAVSALMQFMDYLEGTDEWTTLLMSVAELVDAPVGADAPLTERPQVDQTALAERIREQNKEFRLALAERVGSDEAELAFDRYLSKVQAVLDFAAEHQITVSDSEPPPPAGATAAQGFLSDRWSLEGRASDEHPLGA
jgi:hypothetical protein